MIPQLVMILDVASGSPAACAAPASRSWRRRRRRRRHRGDDGPGPETVEVSTVFLGQKTWENWENPW